jgi:hypothetical protein
VGDGECCSRTIYSPPSVIVMVPHSSRRLSDDHLFRSYLTILNNDFAVCNKPLTGLNVKLLETDVKTCIEMAESHIDKYSIASASYLLHNAVLIHFCHSFAEKGSEIEPETIEGRRFDAQIIWGRKVLVEVGSHYERLINLSNDVKNFDDYAILVVNKYDYANIFDFPTELIVMSSLEEKKQFPYFPDDVDKGIYGPPPFISDISFINKLSRIIKNFHVRKLKAKFHEFKEKKFSFEIKTEDLKEIKYTTWTTRIPWEDIMVFDKRSEEKTNLEWLKEASDRYNNFYISTKDHGIKLNFDKGVWDINFDEKAKNSLYEITNLRKYKHVSKEYYENFEKYWLTHRKDKDKVRENFISRYGDCPSLIDKVDYRVTLEKYYKDCIDGHFMPIDEDMESLFKKCVPKFYNDVILEAFKFLKYCKPYHELMFLKRVVIAAMMHKKNTKSKRLLVSHHYKDVVASISIIGNLSSSQPDDGFIYVRFYYNTIGIVSNSFRHHIIHDNDTHQHCSQGFVFRKADIKWLLHAADTAFLITVGYLEDVSSTKEDLKVKIKSKIHHQAIFNRISIINRHSWGLSRILKPFKFVILGISQKIKNINGAIDKFNEELNKYGGIKEFPDLAFLLHTLNLRNNANLIDDKTTPIFGQPLKLIAYEYSLMNICPKDFYGIKHHVIDMFKTITDEYDLAMENVDRQVDIHDKELQIYNKYLNNKLTCLDNHTSFIELKENVENHLDFLNELSMKQPRFIYSWFTLGMLNIAIKKCHYSKYAGSIHVPDFEDLLTMKGSFNAIRKKPSKALDSVLLESYELIKDTKFPLTTNSIAITSLYKFYFGEGKTIIENKVKTCDHRIPNLYSYNFPKNQVGGGREISEMNGEYRILQSVTESVASYYEQRSGIGKLNDAMKDADYLESLSKTGASVLAINIDRSRWGPNFNTRVFGDMHLLMAHLGYPSVFYSSIINYICQFKKFIKPFEIKCDHKDLINDGDIQVLQNPFHMGEGLKQRNSSQFHSYICIYERDILESVFNDLNIPQPVISQRVTSDDVNWLLKSIDFKENVLKCVDVFIQEENNFLVPASIVNSKYKNTSGLVFSDFNSIIVLLKEKEIIYETMKTLAGLNVPVNGHNYWLDSQTSLSRFNSSLSQGCSIMQGYIIYLVSMLSVYRRWNFLGLFYKKGFFRLLTLDQVLRREPHFPTYYKLIKEEEENFKIIRESDSFSAYKFKTYERYTKLYDILIEHGRNKAKFETEYKKQMLKNAPVAHSMPLSKFLFPHTFTKQNKILLKYAPTASKLIPNCVPEYESVNLRTLAVLTNIPTPISKQETINYSLNINNIMDQLILFMQNSSKSVIDFVNYPVTGKDYYLSKRNVRSSGMKDLNSLFIFMSNFGSLYNNEYGRIHLNMYKNYINKFKFNPEYVNEINKFFSNDKKKIYTYITHIFQTINRGFDDISMTVMGKFLKKNNNGICFNLRKNFIEETYMFSSPNLIPFGLIFNNPLNDIELNPEVVNNPNMLPKMSDSNIVRLVETETKNVIEIRLDRMIMKDYGSFKTTEDLELSISKPSPSYYRNPLDLARFLRYVFERKGNPKTEGFSAFMQISKIQETTIKDYDSKVTKDNKSDFEEMTIASLQDLLKDAEIEVDFAHVTESDSVREAEEYEEEHEFDIGMYDFEKTILGIDSVTAVIDIKKKQITDDRIISRLIALSDQYYLRTAFVDWLKKEERNKLWKVCEYKNSEYFGTHSPILSTILEKGESLTILRFLNLHFLPLPKYFGHFVRKTSMIFEIDRITLKLIKLALSMEENDYDNAMKLYLWISMNYGSNS